MQRFLACLGCGSTFFKNRDPDEAICLICGILVGNATLMTAGEQATVWGNFKKAREAAKRGNTINISQAEHEQNLKALFG